MNPLLNLLLLLLSLSILGCQSEKKTSETTDFQGVLSVGGYRNEVFGFQVKFPDGWEVLDGRTIDDENALKLAGTSVDGEEKEALLEAMNKTYTAFRAIRDSKHDASKRLPNFGVTIEKVGKGGNTTASAYLSHLPQLFKGTGIPFSMQSQPEKKLINGWHCYVASGLITLKEKQVHQIYFCKMKGDRLVLATLSVDDINDQETLSLMENAFSAITQ